VVSYLTPWELSAVGYRFNTTLEDYCWYYVFLSVDYLDLKIGTGILYKSNKGRHFGMIFLLLTIMKALLLHQ